MILNATNNVCLLPLDGGHCVANIAVWGYDGVECRDFAFGGCGGNDNKFMTRQDCENACMT